MEHSEAAGLEVGEATKRVDEGALAVGHAAAVLDECEGHGVHGEVAAGEVGFDAGGGADLGECAGRDIMLRAEPREVEAGCLGAHAGRAEAVGALDLDARGGVRGDGVDEGPGVGVEREVDVVEVPAEGEVADAAADEPEAGAEVGRGRLGGFEEGARVGRDRLQEGTTCRAHKQLSDS